MQYNDAMECNDEMPRNDAMQCNYVILFKEMHCNVVQCDYAMQ